MKTKKRFDELGLSEELLEIIHDKGFEEPTMIQQMTIPVMLNDNANIIAQAQTGTGKTAAFGLPLVQKLDSRSKTVQALILAPTRELAVQVAEEINSLVGKTGLKTVPIYGGQSIDQQLRRLKKGVQIVVGTPGRVIDHLNRKTLNIKEIDYLILDEADEMLNMGFVEDMEKIMKYTNNDKKTLLFSATMPKRIMDLAKKYMSGYELLAAKKTQLATSLTEQIYFEVKQSDKYEALCRIIDIEDNFYGLVFCRTKSDVDSVVGHLLDRGYDTDAIHGDISQFQREKTLGNFRKKRINILVATDVAARGIDVSHLTHVINYSLPRDPESYVHRIGRTGRAGNEGTAITFITPSEYRQLMFIQRITKSDIKKSYVPKISDIIKAKKKKISDDLSSLQLSDDDSIYYNWAKGLLTSCPPTDILASVLKYCFDEELNPDCYNEIKEVNSGRSSVDAKGKARLFVALGKKDKVTASKLIALVAGKISIKSKQISDIQIMDKFSFMTVPFEKAEAIIKTFKQKGKKPLISHVKNDRQKGARKKK